MLETATTKPLRRRADRRSATPPADGARQEEPDRSSSMSGPRQRASESRMNRIARRAHEIYEARGGEHGKALEDWLQAERDIDSEVASQHDDDAR